MNELQITKTYQQALDMRAIDNAAKLSDYFHANINLGYKLEIFFAVAQTNPEALRILNTIIQEMADTTLKALAFHALSQLPPQTREALARYTIMPQGKDLFILLCQEAKNSDDLIAWCALESLRTIYLPEKKDLEHLSEKELKQIYNDNYQNIKLVKGGNLAEPLQTMHDKIIARQLQKIARTKRVNHRDDYTPEYEKCLQFWTLGPIQELFNHEGVAEIDFIADVIDWAGLRGIDLGLRSKLFPINQESFNQLKDVIKEHDNDSPAKKQELNIRLTRFLKAGRDTVQELPKLTQALLFERPTRYIDLHTATMAELENYISTLKQDECNLQNIFRAAQAVSNDSKLGQLLGQDLAQYQSNITAERQKAENQIQAIKNYQATIQHNANVLAEALSQLRGLGESLTHAEDNHAQLKRQLPAKNYEICRQAYQSCDNIKGQILSKINAIHRNLYSQEIEPAEKSIKQKELELKKLREEYMGVGWAFIIFSFACFIFLLSVNYLTKGHYYLPAWGLFMSLVWVPQSMWYLIITCFSYINQVYLSQQIQSIKNKLHEPENKHQKLKSIQQNLTRNWKSA